VDTASRTTEGAANYPLKVRDSVGLDTAAPTHCARRYLQVEVAADGISHVESEFVPERIAHLIKKLDWPALRKTAAEVRLSGCDEHESCALFTIITMQMGIAELPESMPEKPEEDLAFLKSVHDLVLDV
jgi:hypothetical protein